EKWFEGRVPERGQGGELEAAIVAAADELREKVPALVDDLQIHAAIEETLQFVRRLNKYVTDTEPFKVVKTDKEAAGRSLYTVLEGLRHAACLLAPVMPEKMATLTASLGASPTGLLADLRWGGLEPGTKLELGEPLFPRRDLPEAPPAEVAPAPVAPPAPKGGAKAKAAEPAGDGASDVISFDDFAKVKLRAATVLEAERVAGSDKLLRLQVDLGDEKRQIVAGIGKTWEPEAIVGRQVVIVANLAPRKVFKVESQGMVLAVETPDGGLALVTPSAAVAPGTEVR
ncbi:MAG: methionine--tRNA ligase subunit beta, partial [Myxococcales bacterium]|nr:methionine--tRNA ligase subunit beta [Myxococcales bacterium]